MKKIIATILTLALVLSLAACGSSATTSTPSAPSTPSTPADPAPSTPADPAPTEKEEQRAAFSVAALKGPTAMGLVQLMKRSGTAPVSTEAEMPYTFTLAGSADQVSPLLIKGELDMACVPANLASNLYHKTNGQIITLAINTLGVIYIVETGETLNSLSDLAGKTMVGAGKGSTPEFGLRYLLSENNIDPDTGLSIDWKNEHSECVAALASGVASIALLPQPFVTVAQNKIPGLRVALDLTAEWDALDNGSGMVTGVIVARKDVVEANPEAVATFLKDYAESVEWVNSNVADAAQLIAQYGIVEAAAIAEKALPHCNIVCITGEEMKETLSGYLAALAEQEPTAVGGKVPADDFFYIG